MNLTIVKELLGIYKTDSEKENSIDECKLFTICDKIKIKQSEPVGGKSSRTSTTKSSNSQLAPSCWNLLVQINRNIIAFSTPKTILYTAKIALSCGKVVETNQKEFKIGLFDLEKMIANIVSKLLEGLKVPLDPALEHSKYIVSLMEFYFERLQKHYNSLESGLRRMSLVEFPLIDDPFVDVKFHGISPENTKDSVLSQLTIVALESLIRLALIFQKGPVLSMLDTLTQFHLSQHSFDAAAANNRIAHFISNICKIEFWSPLEWKFWKYLGDNEFYLQHLHYFKRRCQLKLTEPDESCGCLNNKIISAVLSTEQLTETMLNCVNVEQDLDEIIGPCLKILLKDENNSHVQTIESILRSIPKRPLTDLGLKGLLSSLDSLKNGLFHLIRNDRFVVFLISLNDCLLRISFPVKFYVSWTSCVLKFAVENRKNANLSNLKELVKVSITGFLEHFDEIPEELQPKVRKILSQSISVTADLLLLEKILAVCDDIIGPILESSTFNLPQDYFNALSGVVFCNSEDETLLMKWVKVLSYQVNVTQKAFDCKDVLALHNLSKFISLQIIDNVKLQQYMDFIYGQMQALKCTSDSIALSKQLVAFKTSKSIDSINYIFKDPNITAIVDTIKMYLKTGNLDIGGLELKDLKNESEIHFELFVHFLMIGFARGSKEEFKRVSYYFAAFKNIYIRFSYFLHLLGESNEFYWPHCIENTKLAEIHDCYQLKSANEALKIGYEMLKSSLKVPNMSMEKALDAIELLIYLHRLSVSTCSYSESKYFLKQLRLLAETLKSENIKLLTDKMQDEFLKLAGSSTSFMNYSECEKVLKSFHYRRFHFEHEMLKNLENERAHVMSLVQTKAKAPFYISCNALRINSQDLFRVSKKFKDLDEGLKLAQKCKHSYFISEWAKMKLFLMFHQSLFESCDEDLLNLFELARNPNGEGVDIKRLKGSIGFLHDQFLSILWIMVVNADAKLLLFKLTIDMPSFSEKMQKIHDICAQNTDSLKNTTEIARDSEKKAQWWKLRKNLDSELIAICSVLNETLFSDIGEIFIPNGTFNQIARNFHSQLNEIVTKCTNGNIFVSESFSSQLLQLGQYPKRHKIETLVKMIKGNYMVVDNSVKYSSEQMDWIVAKIRKCFENAFDSIMPNENVSNAPITAVPFNLIIDKDLNVIPFESFPLFNKFVFKRIPIFVKGIDARECDIFEKVFYIVNPSGDLQQTQERFEYLFKGQPNWEGVIGRKPTPDEFFNGICGAFDLFIYFGHSGGEIYAPLKELKSKLSACPQRKTASSALLIGCSSGKIKSNGIFLAESSIFHYLENRSPLILANLWDVTDKDIDLYIKGVLEDSDLLIPIGSNKLPIKSTANHSTIIEKAHSGRQRCFLKALNGFAPVVYSLI